MSVMIFNGSLDSGSQTTGKIITRYLVNCLQKQAVEVKVFELAQSDIPLLKPNNISAVPNQVEEMCRLFQQANLHLWLAPLYHGSIPGVMKNCLDWLEVTSRDPLPYLSDKTIGMICWASGSHAVDGIYTMNSIAHALRAWPLPFNVPVSTQFLFEPGSESEISEFYKNKLNRLVDLGITRKISVNH